MQHYEWWWIPRSVLKGAELEATCDVGRLVLPRWIVEQKELPEPD